MVVIIGFVAWFAFVVESRDGLLIRFACCYVAYCQCCSGTGMFCALFPLYCGQDVLCPFSVCGGLRAVAYILLSASISRLLSSALRTARRM